MSLGRKEYPKDQSGKLLTSAEAKTKILAYCAYQERCKKEVREKLYSFGLDATDIEKLVTFLVLEGFLNEERFAKSFVRGKFRLKRWGRLRIKKALKERWIKDHCIDLGLKEIDEQEYMDTLYFLTERKWVRITDSNPYIKKAKLFRFLADKGFEPDLIEDTFHGLTGDP